MFSTPFNTKFYIWVTFNLSSASAFNLDKSKSLPFGKVAVCMQSDLGSTLSDKEILFSPKNKFELALFRFLLLA